ncbi:SRPBCC family protein [Panacagrimonas sp.]|uniref:SRPBCC family protein n=1 Tax=Panacagrimonas sp. TaxID=2480088 RepID=UPI003B525EC0
MRFLQIALAVMVALVVGIVAVGFYLPDRLRLQRSIVIERPPATVFTVLHGFRHFSAWSPWAELDPAMQVELSGPVLGPGARYAWRSESASVGSGSQEILASESYRSVTVGLRFGGRDTQTLARYRLEPQADGTRVTWFYEADFGYDLASRYVGAMIGGKLGADYERGLQRLKSHVETMPATDFAGARIEYLEVPAQTIAYWSGRSSTDAGEIAAAYTQAYQRVADALSRDQLKPAGPVLAIGRRWDAEADVYEFDAAVPVLPGTQLSAAAGVKIGQTYAGPVLKAAHQGPNGTLQDHLGKLMAYKRAAGYADNGAPWDVYVSDPATTPEAERVVETYVPVR